MTDQVTQEISRFGFTEEEWRNFHERYSRLSASEPRTKNSDGMVFFDWEADRLRKAFEHFKTADPDVCAVLAHMMWYVNDRNRHTGEPR